MYSLWSVWWKWLIARGTHSSFNNQPFKQFNKKSLLLIDYGLHEVAPSSLRFSYHGHVNAWPLLWFRWSLERFYLCCFYSPSVPSVISCNCQMRGKTRRVFFSFLKGRPVALACLCIRAALLSEACSCMRLLSDPESNFRYFQLGFVALAADLWEHFWALSILFREQFEAVLPSCSHSSVLLFLFFCFFLI